MSGNKFQIRKQVLGPGGHSIRASAGGTPAQERGAPLTAPTTPGQVLDAGVSREDIRKLVAVDTCRVLDG
jgi:hypothetical protein